MYKCTDREKASELLEFLENQVGVLNYEDAFNHILFNYMSGAESLKAMEYMVEEYGLEDLISDN